MVGQSDHYDQYFTSRSNIHRESCDSVSVWFSLPRSPDVWIITVRTAISSWCEWGAVNGNQAYVRFSHCVSESQQSVPWHCVLSVTHCTALQYNFYCVPDQFGRVVQLLSECLLFLRRNLHPPWLFIGWDAQFHCTWSPAWSFVEHFWRNCTVGWNCVIHGGKNLGHGCWSESLIECGL